MNNNMPIRHDASASFARPADTTAYASGDLVANSTTAGSVVPPSFTVSRSKDGSFIIRRAKLEKSTNSTTNASFRLHLYRSSPVPSNGDNGAWLTTKAGYLGFIDITVDKAFADASGPAIGHGVAIYNSVSAPLYVRLDGTTSNKIYGLLEARAAYTPGNAETFIVTLDIEPVL